MGGGGYNYKGLLCVCTNRVMSSTLATVSRSHWQTATVQSDSLHLLFEETKSCRLALGTPLTLFSHATPDLCSTLYDLHSPNSSTWHYPCKATVTQNNNLIGHTTFAHHCSPLLSKRLHPFSKMARPGQKFIHVYREKKRQT